MGVDEINVFLVTPALWTKEVNKNKSIVPLKTMKVPKSAVEERHSLRLLRGYGGVSSVCLEISVIAFDG